MKETPVYEDGEIIGYYARPAAVSGVWTEVTPWGFMIRRKDGEYLPTLYKTRGAAKRALQIKLISHNIIQEAICR
jgi:hypothetical protein